MGLDTSTTTAYTAQSNVLVARYHGVLMSNVWTMLHQAKLPEAYWDYALAQVTACKNLLPHTKEMAIPHVRLLVHQSEELRHIRPFGCRMLYRPVRNKLDTSKPRLQEGIFLGHDGGGVYHVLTRIGVVRTKNVRAMETEFLGIRSERPDQDETSSDDGAAFGTVGILDDGGGTPPQGEYAYLLTYVPLQPRMHG